MIKNVSRNPTHHYGQCTPQLVELQLKHLFSLYTGLKQCFPLMSDYSHKEWQCFPKKKTPDRRYNELILLEEACDKAAFQVKKYQQTLQKYYNQRVRNRSLQVGDLVLKRDQHTKEKTKLLSLWQGPYIVVEIARPGAYRLVEIDGKVLPNTWNTDQLWCF